MYEAFGIVSSSGRNIYVDGMQDYRPIGAFSFLGRYRVIDFPISNMTNSDIARIHTIIDSHIGSCRTDNSACVRIIYRVTPFGYIRPPRSSLIGK